ncbi:organoarsenical effux MFS transporter ArsJ [Thiomicrorhabdus sediminis]|uniref:Organoarsenical effux MFS transporter ArsJ n=1 Tax=Thiomicrorhabdus sediminis TaxID=2580412 RepID=A0A4P9K2X6_9GAMM|nr:organoarsenical effux MFS transporter ArsJ [Thiomicrorhabdus sediminis]QCU89165.1 organoarsenical effux MFS transporter ArsJ [Thiomicrorhabdus sediminis]
MNPQSQYLLVTVNYWAFTLTDGALRMLVLLYFYHIGFSPVEIALLFLFYEIFGIVTNFIGGWIGARSGLHITMISGLALQMLALLMLTVDQSWLTMAYVMCALAISGIAKDLNKMSAKSSVKCLASDKDGTLYKWVTLLTGSKNALKGLGFLIGAMLFEWFGFADALWLMVAWLVIAFIVAFIGLDNQLGKASNKPKFKEMFSPSAMVNWLSAARLFLFGARDIWFAVALPLYLQSALGWSYIAVGTYMAFWIIGYGLIQALTPKILRHRQNPNATTAAKLAFVLGLIPLLMSWQLINIQAAEPLTSVTTNASLIIVIGLMIFGILFALNSSVHSYLIVSAANEDGASKEVGFYYMANAVGRLTGMMLSGYLYQDYGMEICLLASAIFVMLSALLVWQAKPGRTESAI